MKSPANAAPYLADPNYYRLGYQLAAQIVNGRMADRDGAHADDRAQANGDDTPDPLEVANEVLTGASAMVAWYEKRAGVPRWRRFTPPKPHEIRLWRFLEGTVIPCTHLIAAAAMRDEGAAADHAEVARHVGAVVEAAEDGRISYRAHYALACWYARAGAVPQSTVMRHLDTAMATVRPEPGYELAEWSLRDPALASLRTRMGVEKFAAHVEPFRRPTDAVRRAGRPLPDAVEQSLRSGTSETFEVVGSTFARDGAPTDDVVRTITAFLNTQGGTLLIGAIEAPDKGRWADAEIDAADEDAEGIEDWVLRGIDRELGTTDWNAYTARLRKAIAARIKPDPQAYYEVVPYVAGDRTMAVVTVTADDSDRYYVQEPKTFWGRVDASNVPFDGEEIEAFKKRVKQRVAGQVSE